MSDQEINKFASPAENASVAETVVSMDAQIAQLRQSYEFVDTEQLLSFLAQHPQVVEILLQTRAKIDQHFESAQTALEYYEDDEDSIRILLLICTTLEVEPAMEQMRQFEQEWWLNQLKPTEYTVQNMLEFV